MSDDQLNLPVETPPPAPVSAPEQVTEAPTPNVEPNADKSPSLRDSLSKGLATLHAERAQAAERARDEAGRFARNEAKQVAPEAAAAQQPAQAVKAPERPADMPKAWGADKAALWSALTPEQRAYVTERETQAEQLHNNYGGLRKFHEAALENGTTLAEAVEKMAAVETKMYESPPDGLIMAMQAVGLDHQSAVRTLVGALQKLGVNLNGTQMQPGQPAHQPQQFRDPRVDQMMAERQQEKLRQAQEAVAKFRADPANKYFDEVSDDIMRWIAFDRSQGKEPDIQQIYDRAVRANPSTYQKLLAEHATKQAEALAQAKTQELARARSASGSVAGTLPAVEGRKPAKPASLRDDLTQKVRALMSGRV